MSVIFINPYRFATQQLWTPAAITTALWLDANDSGTITQSGGAITTWADKSGNNRTATVDGNPTYSATGLSTGRPAVQLDGTGDGFVSSITGIGSFNALDVYMVTQTTAAAAADTSSAIFWGYGNVGNASGPYPAARTLALVSSTGAVSGELITISAENAAALAGRLCSNSYARAANTAQILNSRNATTGTSLLVNGSSVTLNLASQITTSSNTAPSAIGYTVDSNLYIGASRGNGTLAYSPAIKFAEVIVSSTLLSTDNRQRMEGYLAHKWGLTANLPADHPYKSVPPYLTYDVDAAAYIAAVEAADGQTLEAGVKDAINAFVIGCKADGIWNAIKASCIMAGARTLAGALQPLVGTAPTNFNFVAGDYNRKTGLVGNGSTKYLAANYTYPADLQNNCHAALWESGSSATGIYLGAADDGSSGSFINAGNKSSRHYNSSSFTFVPTTFGTTGFQGIARSSALSYQYRSAVGGTQTATISSATLTLPSFNVFRRNRPTTPDNFSLARLAFYSIGESLNLALLDARVTALMYGIQQTLLEGDFDIDAAAYISRVETADNQDLEPAVRTAINNFVVGCKADGIWNAIKASCIMAGARTLNGALQPLVGTAPTNFNFVAGDYNRKTGLVGNGTTKYLDSNRNNNADPDTQHCSVYMSTAPTSGVSLIGAGISATGVTNVLLGGSRSRNATAVSYPAIATAPSFVGISRGSSSSYIQRSNSTTTSVTQSSETPVSANLLLYARLNTTTATVELFSNPRIAFYSIGESLNLALLDARVTTLINAFAAAIP